MDSDLTSKLLLFEEWIQRGSIKKPKGLKITYFPGTGFGLSYEPPPQPQLPSSLQVLCDFSNSLI